MRTFLFVLCAFSALGAEPRLNLEVSGKGAATVVLEAGFGSGAEEWARIAPEVAKFARVVAYDRAGLGKSEASAKKRTATQVARELHAALKSAKVRPPYVLVGHSAGGAYLRLFAHLYPKDVAGLVYIDPPMEEFLDWLKAKHPEMDGMPADRLARLPAGVRAEWDARDAIIEEMRGAWPVPAVPTVLLTSAKNDQSMAEGLGSESLQVMRDAREHWLHRIPGAKQIVTEKSGHDIPGEEPELVIDVIRQVVRQRDLRASGGV